MWAQLAMALGKSYMDNQANKQQLASNVITQKYAPWTGQTANFSAQGKNSTFDNLLAGYGAGMLQDKADKAHAADEAAKALGEKQKEWNDDAAYYSKLSANPASVGASPIKGQSAFSSVAKAPAAAVGRSPAVMEGANQGTPESNQFMNMLQSRTPWSESPSTPLGPYQPNYQPTQLPAQKVDPTQAMRSNIWSMLPNSMPIKQGW